jgi:DNA-binding PadR family transcriptional regulator
VFWRDENNEQQYGLTPAGAEACAELLQESASAREHLRSLRMERALGEGRR